MVHRARGLLAAVAVALGAGLALSPAIIASNDTTREIAFRHIHTNETLTVVYKRDGHFIPEAIDKINWIMRDWRKNQQTKMDPELIDLIWEIHTELGSKVPVDIICGFRSHATNELLRRTVGGQASQSQHITGKAADITFPDVPLKQLRYSALIRERGGVGYYPTSGIPFVHVDTARVRHWPRLPRFELALLFPDGRSHHTPADGNPITRDDVRTAQANHRDVATQIAAFFNLRAQPKSSVQVAAAPTARPVLASLTGASTPAAAKLPAPAGRQQVALLEQAPMPAPPPVAGSALERQPPRLVTEPRLIERSSRFTPSPSDADRARLDALVSNAAFKPGAAKADKTAPRLIAPPAPAARPTPASGSLSGGMPPAPVAAGSPQQPAAGPKLAALSPSQSPAPLNDASWGNGFVTAPAYDEEHPEELSYRPFPVAPYMTLTASADDPALVRLTHPDVSRTLDAIDDGGAILPMRMRPGVQVAKLMWAQEFRGEAADFTAMQDSGSTSPAIADHPVKTAAR